MHALAFLLGPLDCGLGLVVGAVVDRDGETLLSDVEREVLNRRSDVVVVGRGSRVVQRSATISKNAHLAHHSEADQANLRDSHPEG